MTQALLPDFDETFCRNFNILPVSDETGKAKMLVSEASDLAVIGFIQYRANSPLSTVWINQQELLHAMEALFADQKEDDRPAVPAQVAAEEQSVVTYIDQLIASCLHDGASDIHLEPSQAGLICRARIDGILINRPFAAANNAAAVISRLKIMCGLDIAEKRRPQDGRIRFDYEGRSVDIRVSTIPTEFGEKAVLRLLDKKQLRLDLSLLGFSPTQLAIFKDKITTSNGIILVTGPTGSGKTTTLYGALNTLKSSELNISTIEDPIEYHLPGINQTQVKPGINLTFASMLRSLLRQDPNVIMVGEIRDQETLEIAIQASLTGHLVFSTIHTNSAISTINRLIDMGAEPFLLSSSLRLIVAQRLVRRNCPNCLTLEMAERQKAAAVKLGIELGSNARSGSGCKQCNMTGYKGRIGIFELLPIDGSLKDAISQQLPEHEIGQLAAQQGFVPMTEVARQLIQSGQTTPVEVLRELSA